VCGASIEAKVPAEMRKLWQRPELVEAVKTLLSLGADPNYTNGHGNSFAPANAVHGTKSTSIPRESKSGKIQQSTNRP
jgi:hypothetical protein